MEQPNVYYDSAENGQAERDKLTDQEQQATDDLESANEINVAALKKGVQIFTGQTLREGRHWKETQKCIGTKENENKPEKNADNDRENFHAGDGKLIQARIPMTKFWNDADLSGF